MLYSEVIAVCSEIHTKHVSAMCGQKVRHFIFKFDSTYTNH
jgi:hypothetical protein